MVNRCTHKGICIHMHYIYIYEYTCICKKFFLDMVIWVYKKDWLKCQTVPFFFFFSHSLLWAHQIIVHFYVLKDSKRHSSWILHLFYLWLSFECCWSDINNYRSTTCFPVFTCLKRTRSCEQEPTLYSPKYFNQKSISTLIITRILSLL